MKDSDLAPDYRERGNKKEKKAKEQKERERKILLSTSTWSLFEKLK